MSLTIRPFTFSDSDYQAYVDVFNAAHPEVPRAVPDIQHLDKSLGSDEVLGRWLVEVGGQVVGLVEYMSPENPKAGTLDVRYRVLPEHKDLTPQMWAFLMAETSKQNPKELQTSGREDWDEVAFYRTQNFVEFDRWWGSILDVQAFDPAPFERPLAESIAIKTLSQFDWQSEEFQRHWHALTEVTLMPDVPSVEPMIPWAFENWQARHTTDPKLIPEGIFFAVEGDRLVGISELYKSSRPQTLQTGLTGTLASHRRKGIALALKLKAAAFAKGYGVRYIRASNHQLNRPMLAINEAMGFQKEPAFVQMAKEWQP
ncbi:MAG: GNAT family N-acetyltransferase [Meiothermus sp.]|nr:GNAT family N-acetyltransferase [Meiothermus sp.]